MHDFFIKKSLQQLWGVILPIPLSQMKNFMFIKKIIIETWSEFFVPQNVGNVR
jgi:hypothetical protein